MHLKRSIGLLGLTFVGVSGIIGSGWLFAPLLAAKLAGPAAMISWGIGGGAMLILALCFAEVIGVFPVAGGIVRIPHFTHGDLTSSVLGWSAWIGYNTAAPIETVAMMQYLSPFFPWLFVGESSEAILSFGGTLFAMGVLIFFVVLNAFGAAFFARTNTGLTWIKLGVPLVGGLTIVYYTFDFSNFSSPVGFAPFGIRGIFAAVSSGGIIFALIGFRHAIDMAGEVKRPNVTLPLALGLSLLISIGVYAVIQLAFLGALTEEELAGGWDAIHFQHGYGPLASITAALGIGWVSVMITGGAVIAPFGGGLVSTGSMARLAYALSQNRLLPGFFEVLSRHGVPLRCLILNLVFGVLVVLFVPFGESIALNGAAITLSFCAGPIAVYAMRSQYPRGRAAISPARGRVLGSGRFRRGHAHRLLEFLGDDLAPGSRYSGWPLLLLHSQDHGETLEMQQAGFTTQEIQARENEIRQRSISSTRQAMKEHFVLDRVAEIEDIEVSPSDIEHEIRLMAMQRGESPRRLRARLTKSGVIENLEAQIRERKAVDKILENAVFEDVEMDRSAEDQVEAVNQSVYRAISHVAAADGTEESEADSEGADQAD